MRKFEVTTDNGMVLVCQLSDAAAREIATKCECKCYALAEGVPHSNPVMDGGCR